MNTIAKITVNTLTSAGAFAAVGGIAGGMYDFDLNWEDDRPLSVEAAADDLNYGRQQIEGKDTIRGNLLEKYGSVCVNKVIYFSVGGELYDVEEPQAVDYIRENDDTSCGDDSVEVLVALREIRKSMDEIYAADLVDLDSLNQQVEEARSNELQKVADKKDNWLKKGFEYGTLIGLAGGFLASSISVVSQNRNQRNKKR